MTLRSLSTRSTSRRSPQGSRRPTGSETSSSRSAGTCRPLHVGACRRRRARLLSASTRMTEPLVVVDADVLGRRRTGDETYMRNLLRELGSLAAVSGFRIAAATRHPELVPAGIEPLVLRTPLQELRMAPDAAAAAPPHARSARAHAVRGSRSFAVSSRGHDPRSLVRARIGSHGAEGPARLPPSRPTGRACCPPRADGLRTHTDDLVRLYGLPDEKVVVTPNGVDPAFAPGNS